MEALIRRPQQGSSNGSDHARRTVRVGGASAPRGMILTGAQRALRPLAGSSDGPAVAARSAAARSQSRATPSVNPGLTRSPFSATASSARRFHLAAGARPSRGPGLHRYNTSKPISLYIRSAPLRQGLTPTIHKKAFDRCNFVTGGGGPPRRARDPVHPGGFRRFRALPRRVERPSRALGQGPPR